MNIRTALFVTTSLLGALALAACDSGDGGTGGAGGDGTGGTGNTGNAGGSGGTGGNVNAMDGWIRLAHMSPDSMGVDFCVTGADGMARPSGYAAAGVVYPGAGAYVTLPADTYEISLIGAGLDCSAPLLTIPDFALAAGTYQTVLVDGMAANNTLAANVIEDFNVPAAGNVVLNACHENGGAPPVQVGMLDANDMFVSLFNDPGAITFNYQDCYSQEVPAPIAQGTVLAVSTDGVTIDGRWTVPVDLATAGATVWIYGTDATDIGAYACINVGEGTCTALPVAN